MVVPTLDPVEERIIANLQTTLAGISPTSLTANYYTQVNHVFVMDQAPTEETVDQPAIVIVHVGTTRQFYCQDLDECVLSVDLYLIQVRNGDTWRRDAERFAADVRKALLLDRGRGSVSSIANAFDTDIVDEAQPNLLEANNTTLSRIAVKVVYRESILDPTVSA
jgi:hypothetical protein